MEIYFYCPSCGTIEGFSTAPKSENETFDSLRVINDSELLEKAFEE